MTRSVFGEKVNGEYPCLWTANDSKVKVSLNLSNSSEATITPSADFKSATFTCSINDPEEAAYTFYAVSPATASLSFSATNNSIGFTVPTAQTPTANSVDEAAQVLYAVSETTNTFPSSVNLSFKHFTAYGLISLVNLDETANVSSVALTSDDETPITNRFYFDPSTDATTVSSAGYTVTINTSSRSNIWFAIAPAAVGGKTWTVKVSTDKGVYSKEVTFPAGKEFKSGTVAKFSINYAGITPTEDIVYTKVTDVNELTIGSEIIIAAKSADYAIGTTQNANNRTQAAITKEGDTILNPGDDVEILTLGAGSSNGTYSFYATKSATKGYIAAASDSNNQMHTDNNLTAASSFTVSFDNDGTAHLVAAQYDRNCLFYNAEYSIFSCYASTSSMENKDIVLYSREGTPVTPPSEGEWELVTSIDDITPGQYVIVASTTTKTGYLPSSFNTSSAPGFETENITIEGNKITSTVSESMYFIFSGTTSSMTIQNSNGNSLYAINNNNGIRVGGTTDTWVIAAHDSGDQNVFQFKETTNNRFLGVYSNQDWRSYTAYNATNYTNATGSSKIKLYKKSTQAGTLTPLTNPLYVSIDDNVVSWPAVENAGSYTITIGGNTKDVTTTSYTFNNSDFSLADGYYAVSVIAKPSDTSSYSDSEPTTSSDKVKVGTPTIATPELSEGNITATSITVTWTVDPHATSGYQCSIVGIDKSDEKVVTEGTVTFDNLSPNTQYTITVYGIQATVDGDLWEHSIHAESPFTTANNNTTATLILDNLGAAIGSTSNTSMSTVDITATGTSDEYTLNYLQGKKQGNSILLAKSTDAFISNNTPMPGNIKSITVYINSGASGKTTYYCAFSTTECTTAYTAGSSAVNITGGSNYKYTCSVNGAKYFCVSLGNANNGQVLKLEIEYEAN